MTYKYPTAASLKMDNTLELSEYERGYLTAHYIGYCTLQEYKCYNGDWYEHLLDGELEWESVLVGDRLFDLCFSMDRQIDPEYPDEPDYEYPESLVVIASENKRDENGLWVSDLSKTYTLKSTNE
jgi:hypothetical protein